MSAQVPEQVNEFLKSIFISISPYNCHRIEGVKRLRYSLYIFCISILYKDLTFEGLKVVYEAIHYLNGMKV